MRELIQRYSGRLIGLTVGLTVGAGNLIGSGQVCPGIGQCGACGACTSGSLPPVTVPLLLGGLGLMAGKVSLGGGTQSNGGAARFEDASDLDEQTSRWHWAAIQQHASD